MIPTIWHGGFPLGRSAEFTFDPYAADVVLLMRMEGADAGTTFVDSGPLGLTIWNSGRTTSTDYAKSGLTSLKENNTGYTYVDGTASTPLTGVFTIESWNYWTADTGAATALWNALKSGGFGLLLWRDHATQKIGVDGGVSGTITGNTYTNNTWHHTAVTRDGSNVITLWQDGAQAGSTISDSNTWFYNGIQSLRIACADSGVYNMGATAATYKDLLRVTKVCRYTGAFTPRAY